MMVGVASSLAMSVAVNCFETCGRYGFGGCKSGFVEGKMSCMTAAASINGAAKRMRLGVSPLALALTESSAAAKDSNYKKILEDARDKFTREITIQSKDKDVSLAKACDHGFREVTDPAAAQLDHETRLWHDAVL